MREEGRIAEVSVRLGGTQIQLALQTKSSFNYVYSRRRHYNTNVLHFQRLVIIGIIFIKQVFVTLPTRSV